MVSSSFAAVAVVVVAGLIAVWHVTIEITDTLSSTSWECQSTVEMVSRPWSNECMACSSKVRLSVQGIEDGTCVYICVYASAQ